MMDKERTMGAAPCLYKNENMTAEEKYKLLMDSLKKIRVAFGPEKAKDSLDIVKQSIKGWAVFCGFFDAYIKTEKKKK